MEFLERFIQSLTAALVGVGLLNFLTALLILIVGYIVAKLIERAVAGLLRRTDVDNRLARATGGPTTVSVEEGAARFVFYILMLFVLAAVFQRLNLTVITVPLNRLLTQIVAFIPKLLGAGIILVVGYMLATILRRLVTNITARLGIDRLAERTGVRRPLSNLLGTLVYALILIPTIIAALNALEVEAISGPATTMLQTLLNAIPAIFGAALLLGITYVVARLIAGIVTELLAGLGFNELVARLGFGRLAATTQRTPADIVGTILLVAIMLFAAVEAADLLGFQNLATILTGFLIFGGRVLIAMVVFGLGFYLANLARDLILGSGGQNAPLLAMIARGAILVFTGAMALRELGLAEDIVNLAFGLTLGAITVAAALAFGLGSREIAGREVERMLQEARSQPQIPPPIIPTTRRDEMS